MNKSLPIVAIVGEPNVGKSTLLNKIAGTRLAVTSTVAGTTRDRQYVDTVWNGVNFFWPSKYYIGGTGDIWWWNNYDIFLIVLSVVLTNTVILLSAPLIGKKIKNTTFKI